MRKPAIPVFSPDSIIRQFVTPEGNRQARQRGHVEQRLTTNFFTLMRIEDIVKYVRFPVPAGRRFHYDFMLVTGGSLQRTYGLESHSISPATFTVYRAGTIVSTDTCSPDAAGYFGVFDAAYILTTFKNPHALDELSFFQPDSAPVLSIDSITEADWLGQLTRIERALGSNRSDQQTYISTLLYSFLLDVQEQYRQQTRLRPRTSTDRITDQFRELLTRHVLTKRSVSDYADLLSITPNHLNKRVKETVGKSASTLIAELLVLEAKVLLHQPDFSISEVAYQLQFDTLSYFARFFRKHTGMTPTEYRQKA